MFLRLNLVLKQTMNIRSLVYLAKFRKNLRLDIKKLEKIQQKEMNAVIRHAYKNVPFYNRKFKNAGIKPGDIKYVSDLSKLPLTTKTELQMTKLDDFISRDYKNSRFIRKTTSGSTGIPLTILIDKKGEDAEGAIWIRTLLENGLQPRDKMVEIGDPRHFPKKRSISERLHFTSRKRISIFDDSENQIKILKDYKPDVIKGYTSSLAILAEELKQKQLGVKTRLVFSTAELLDNQTRRLICSGFETDLLDNYACSEFSLLAWECHEHDGYHINMDNIIMEFLRDGEPIESEEQGEIVCTSLNNYAMPLIRYKMEDVGIPKMDKCTCGVTLPLMKTIKGRKDDFLTTINGNKISPTVFFPYPFENTRNIQQFRVIQEKINKIKIEIVFKKEDVNPTLFEEAKVNIQRIFGKDMQVEFQVLKKIPNGKTKMRKITSKVNASW